MVVLYAVHKYAFATCVFFCYIVIVIATFALFVLFYSDTTDGFTAHSILVYAVKNYHINRNLAEIVDSLQENLKCCGVSSTAQGYRDWNLSYQFNCSASNPQPEKCSVPFSCCRKSVISEAAGSSDSLLPAMRSLECWQNTLNKRPQDLEHDIYTRGCLQPLRNVFESNATHIAFAVTVIVVPVCISICLTNVLARQINHQRILLEREARRKERQQKRECRRGRTRTNGRHKDGKTSDYEPKEAIDSSKGSLVASSKLPVEQSTKLEPQQ
ncbi:tetraspanin family protein [Ostertagia ostertagi]